MDKIKNNKNYRDEDDNLNKIYKQKDLKKNKNALKHNFQRNLTCRNLENKNNNQNKCNDKKINRNYSKGEILKEKNYKKEHTKSGIITRNENKSKNKKEKENDNNLNKKENEIKKKVRSKSVARIEEMNLLNKNDTNEERNDIEFILYGEIKPGKDEDPFDDVDSVVKAIDFDSIKLNMKNIFSVEENENYQKYSESFESKFNKIIEKNEEKKNQKNYEKNDTSNSRSENTTDSLKKNKTNTSFIKSQN